MKNVPLVCRNMVWLYDFPFFFFSLEGAEIQSHTRDGSERPHSQIPASSAAHPSPQCLQCVSNKGPFVIALDIDFSESLLLVMIFWFLVFYYIYIFFWGVFYIWHSDLKQRIEYWDSMSFRKIKYIYLLNILLEKWILDWTHCIIIYYLSIKVKSKQTNKNLIYIVNSKSRVYKFFMWNSTGINSFAWFWNV